MTCPPILIRVCLREERLGPWLPIQHTAKTDNTGRMPRLIWVFAGHTSFCWWCHTVAEMSLANITSDETSTLMKHNWGMVLEWKVISWNWPSSRIGRTADIGIGGVAINRTFCLFCTQNFGAELKLFDPVDWFDNVTLEYCVTLSLNESFIFLKERARKKQNT